MFITIGKFIITAIVVEVLAILVLVVLVALFGPANQNEAQAYAERLGYWVGPIAGFIFCIVGGWFVARNLAAHQMLYGLVLGAVVAAIDIAILGSSGAKFEPIFVVSNIGRVVAGGIGGWLAQ